MAVLANYHKIKNLSFSTIYLNYYSFKSY